MSADRKAQVGRGLMIAAVILALPGARSLASGDLAMGLGLLAIPALLVGGGLSLKWSAELREGRKAGLPIALGLVTAVVLVAVAVVYRPSRALVASDVVVSPSEMPSVATDVVVSPPDVADVAPPGLSSEDTVSPMPTHEELEWLPPRDEVDSADMPAYDEYVALVAQLVVAERRMKQAGKAYDAALRESKATTKRYNKDQVSYSVYIKAYGRAQDAREKLTEASEKETDIRLDLSVMRIELTPEFSN